MGNLCSIRRKLSITRQHTPQSINYQLQYSETVSHKHPKLAFWVQLPVLPCRAKREKKNFHLTHVKKSNKNYPQSNKKMLTTFFICVILILGGWHDLYNA
ncbi:hypothetical protein [Tortoise microvirus 104]|nr:hypothetical protein [Tortoise microvirus 104]